MHIPKNTQTVIIRSAGAFVLLAVLASVALVRSGLEQDIAPCDVGVVLGNKVERDGTPSRRLMARLDKAVELYRQMLFERVIVSGARGKEGWNEALVMRDYLLNQGVPDSAVVVDTNGSDTYHTAQFTADYLRLHGKSSAMVVSQYFHVPRTVYALRRLGVTQVRKAHSDFFEIRDPYSILREVIEFAKYYLRSYKSGRHE